MKKTFQDIDSFLLSFPYSITFLLSCKYIEGKAVNSHLSETAASSSIKEVIDNMSETLTSCCTPGIPVQKPNPFPCKDIYVVEAGDTLYMIAQHYDIPVSLLMQANRVLNPYNLKIGQKICIPFQPGEMPRNDPDPADSSSAEMPSPEPRAQETPNASNQQMPAHRETCPMPPVSDKPQNTVPRPPYPMECADTHIVAAGDTLYMIAKQYRITLDALMRANPSLNPYNLRIGTQLCIPSCKE